MTLTIDSKRCQGHGRCCLVSPELFDMNDDGVGVVLVSEPGSEYARAAEIALDNCPEGAITDSARSLS